MSKRSSENQIEGSDYKDKCSQWADDVGGMSNHEKGKTSPRKEKIGVNHNITLLLSLRL